MIQANGPARPPIRVSCIQFEPGFGAVAANMARASDLVRTAAAEGSRLIVLPELASTGYVFETRRRRAPSPSRCRTARPTRAWSALAEELGVHFVAGIAERAGDSLQFGAVIAAGRLYRHLPQGASLGPRKPVLRQGRPRLPGVRHGARQDRRRHLLRWLVPETFRQLALRGAEIVCVPTNWVPMPDQPAGEAAMANVLHRAAAHSNGIFIACADRVGVERGQPFEGQSLIVGPRGWTLAGPASRDEPETVSAQSTSPKPAARTSTAQFASARPPRRRLRLSRDP